MSQISGDRYAPLDSPHIVLFEIDLWRACERRVLWAGGAFLAGVCLELVLNASIVASHIRASLGELPAAGIDRAVFYLAMIAFLIACCCGVVGELALRDMRNRLGALSEPDLLDLAQLKGLPRKVGRLVHSELHRREMKLE